MQNFEIKDVEKGTSQAWLQSMVGRNDDRAIGSLATGRDDMLLSERRNYENGKSYAEETAKQKKDESIGDKFWNNVFGVMAGGEEAHPVKYRLYVALFVICLILIFGMIVALISIFK